MPALVKYACEGSLTINSVLLNTPAYSVGGDDKGEGTLLDLWGLMADRRGENRKLPGAAGVIPYPKEVDETPYALRLIIIGDVNSSGVAYSDDRVGLQTNLGTFKTLIDTSSSGNGTVTASLTRFTGSAITAPVQVLRLEREEQNLSPDGKGGSYWTGLLHITIPTGRLA